MLGLLLQGFDGGDGVERLEALVVAGDLRSDDGFGLRCFPAAACLVAGGYLAQVVDVVDEAAVKRVDAGVDVAGDGDIDEEDGLGAAAMEDFAGGFWGEERGAGTGGSDDDVGAVSLGGQGLERYGLGAGLVGGEEVSDASGAVGGAVGDEEVMRAVLDEVADGELGHFSGADEQDCFAGERAEDFSCEIDRDGRDGDGGGADLGFGANLFCDREGGLEEAVE